MAAGSPQRPQQRRPRPWATVGVDTRIWPAGGDSRRRPPRARTAVARRATHLRPKGFRPGRPPRRLVPRNRLRERPTRPPQPQRPRPPIRRASTAPDPQPLRTLTRRIPIATIVTLSLLPLTRLPSPAVDDAAESETTMIAAIRYHMHPVKHGGRISAGA